MLVVKQANNTIIAKIMDPNPPNKYCALADRTGAPVSKIPNRSTLVAPMLAMKI